MEGRSSHIVAFCGLLCDMCPIYLATREEDKEAQLRMRTDIARICREQYGLEYQLVEITDCDGCGVEGGRLFSGCRKCTIRSCAMDKGLKTCAECPDYPCAQLLSFFEGEPDARERLDEIWRLRRRNF
jgi:hypothetical protein